MNNFNFSGINDFNGFSLMNDFNTPTAPVATQQKSIGSIGKVSGQGNNIAEIQKAVVKKNNNVNSSSKNTVSSNSNSNTSKGKSVVEKIRKYSSEISIGNIIIGLLITYLIVNLAYITSETYRVGSAVIELNKYTLANAIDYRYLFQEGRQEKPLKNFFIATSFRPYLAKNQLLEYASERIVKQTVKCGPRCMVVDIFNDTLSDDAFPTVSSGFEKGNWKLTLNSMSFDKLCNTLSQTVFTSGYVNNYDDPFILVLNLKTNGNYKCHDRVQEILYKYFKNRLLPSKFSYGKADILNTRMKELMGKIVIMTNVSPNNSKLNEITNFSIDRDDFNKISYKSLVDEVSASENIKLNTSDVRIQMRENLALVVPDENSFFTRNYNPQNFFDTGCQLIAMNYQRVDRYMEQYFNHFKGSSFVEKPKALQSL
jgi:hypothetical protein